MEKLTSSREYRERAGSIYLSISLLCSRRVGSYVSVSIDMGMVYVCKMEDTTELIAIYL